MSIKKAPNKISQPRTRAKRRFIVLLFIDSILSWPRGQHTPISLLPFLRPSVSETLPFKGCGLPKNRAAVLFIYFLPGSIRAQPVAGCYDAVWCANFIGRLSAFFFSCAIVLLTNRLRFYACMFVLTCALPTCQGFEVKGQRICSGPPPRERDLQCEESEEGRKFSQKSIKIGCTHTHTKTLEEPKTKR